jgi:hypothetical protein
LSDHLQQTSPGSVIAFVGFEVLAEAIDFFCQHGDLEIGGTSISSMELILAHDFLLPLLR